MPEAVTPPGGKRSAAALPAVSRQRSLYGDRVDIPLPPVPAGQYLVGYLFEVGPTVNGGMGPAPVSWAELDHWQRQTGLALKPWEARTVRRLSAEYCNELSLAKDPARPAPWGTAPTTSQREAVAKRLRIGFQAEAAALRHDKQGRHA